MVVPSFRPRLGVTALIPTCELRPTFVAVQTAQVTGVVEHWPASTRWVDPGYLLRVAGCRTVPIEVGSHYLAEEWRQDMARATLAGPCSSRAPERAESCPP